MQVWRLMAAQLEHDISSNHVSKDEHKDAYLYLWFVLETALESNLCELWALLLYVGNKLNKWESV